MCLVKKIAKQALVTFENTESSLFPVQFEKLLDLTEKVNEEEVGLNSEKKRQKSDAPVTFINLYEGRLFTMGIFIIRKGNSLPLHDHPGMIGVCKPLFGTIHLKSFQKVETPEYFRNNHLKGLVIAKQVQDKSIRYQDGGRCQVLTPRFENFHAISAITEDAAIFDILAPPYSNTRDCSYYKEVALQEQNSYGLELSSSDREKGLTILKQVLQPMDFYCDSEEYTGPAIDIDGDS